MFKYNNLLAKFISIDQLTANCFWILFLLIHICLPMFISLPSKCLVIHYFTVYLYFELSEDHYASEYFTYLRIRLHFVDKAMCNAVKLDSVTLCKTCRRIFKNQIKPQSRRYSFWIGHAQVLGIHRCWYFFASIFFFWIFDVVGKTNANRKYKKLGHVQYYR